MTATALEKTAAQRDRVVRDAYQAFCTDVGIPLSGGQPPHSFADILGDTALHEAGHVVASAFLVDTKYAFVDYATVIGADQCLQGHASIPGASPYRVQPSPARAFQWQEGFRLMVLWTAGLGAVGKATDDPLDYYWWMEESGMDAIAGEDGSVEVNLHPDMGDGECVQFAANSLANTTWPPRRIIQRAIDLTNEMLEIPEVWACVTKIADLLLDHGTLNYAQLTPVCAPIKGLAAKLPKWLRRFNRIMWKQSEMD